jgi:RecA-family ATPase
MTPFDVRMALHANGYCPIPVMGKRPAFRNWQEMRDAGPEHFRGWDVQYPSATNTGNLTEPTPTFDIDVRHPEAAEECAAAVSDWIGDTGPMLTRFGNAPKRAVIFRTDKPFSKIYRDFCHPNDKPDDPPHRLEFLCDGQQVVFHGVHDKTGKEYSWHGGSPLTVARKDLPGIDEENARKLLDHCADILIQQVGFVDVTGKNSVVTFDTSGQAPAANGDGGVRSDEPFDPFEMLAQIKPSGADVNDKQPRIIMSLLQREYHPEDVLDIVVKGTLEIANAANLGWTREVETDAVTKRINWALQKLNGEYDPTTGEVPSWLPIEHREKWANILKQGGKPSFQRNAAGWFVRPFFEAANRAISDIDAPSIVPSANTGKKAKGPFIIRPFAYFDPAQLPQREWLYGRHYQRRTVSCTTAPGGFGKTTMDMIESVAMTTCRDLLGEQPLERLRVWIHNGEDNLIELNRRIAAICQYYKIDMRELEGWLFLTSGSEFPLKVATGFSDLHVDKPLVDRIAEQIAENKIDVAILDPLITLHGVSEGDNVRMDTVIRLFSGIADGEDCAIELSHHMRKMPAGVNADYTAADIRGATAIFDAVRSARVLNRMSDKEGAELGLPEFERSKYLRVDKAKGNYSPAAKAVWRKFENVELPNGDEVGVLAPWNYPGQGLSSAELAEIARTAELVFLQLLHKFVLQGRGVSDKRQGSYAPKVFAKEPEAKTAKLSATRLENAMQRLFSAGKIKVEGSSKRGSRIVPA